MKLFFKGKDGGPESNVTGYWLIEAKGLFSIVLLCFDRGSREAYHNHAFNAWSWPLKGLLMEVSLHDGGWFPGAMVEQAAFLRPSWKPIYTPRDRMHKVYGIADKTWVLSFRGPWADQWKEWLPNLKRYVTLTHGRKILG